MPSDERQPANTYPADAARQGEIILRSRWQRIVFIGGLVGCVVLVLILWLWMAVS
jgi:hypothetical protein